MPGDVGDMGDGNEPRPLVQQSGESGHVQAAGAVDRRDHQLDTDPIAKKLPGHDVGMMFQLGNDHLIAGAQERGTPGVSDQIKCLGGAADEDDLGVVRSVEKPSNRVPRSVVTIGRSGAQTVDAAMHVGIVGSVELRQSIDHRTWLLRACRGVEEDQAGIALEYRELVAEFPRIENRRRWVSGWDVHGEPPSWSSQARM